MSTSAVRSIPDVTGLDMAFGGKALEILPPWEEIPEEFKGSNNRWVDVASLWFFKGLKGAKFTPRSGVDTNKALRAIQACLVDFAPSHEHKEAGVAYLLSEWFEDVEMP